MRRPFLDRCDPLAKVAAVLPGMIFLALTRTVGPPLLILAASLVLLAFGARLSWRVWAGIVVGGPAAAVLLATSIALWVDPGRVPGSPEYWSGGVWHLTESGPALGFATAARLLALGGLAAVIGLTTTARGLVLAAITHLRLPYRVGYAVLVGVRLAPVALGDLRTVRHAFAVRGLYRGRDPVTAARRWWACVLPVTSSTLRRAERVALAMDARAFGAHPTRTERDPPVLRGHDALLVAGLWFVTAACIRFG